MENKIFFQDPLKLSGLKYLLQTSIEAMIDIAYHVAAKEFCYPPNDARDALKVLMEKGVISASEFDIYVAMVGLRNRLVHGYERVSAEVLYEVVTKQIDDFEKFIGSIMPIIRSKKSDR